MESHSKNTKIIKTLMHNLKLNLIFSMLFCIVNSAFGQFEINETKYNIYAVNTPKNISFANEKTPINQLDIRERFDKEILINTYWQSKTILLIKRAEKYFPIIEPILKQYNIPDDFKYLALAESGLENITSPSGAKGFWQILKKTGIELNLEINQDIDERYHLEKSTEAACIYIKQAYEMFKNWTLAAAAYNMGPYGLKKAIEQQQVNNYYDLMLNDETYRYVFRILALKEILENRELYGFIINENDYYQTNKLYSIKVDTAIHNIAEFALEKKHNYKILKQHNPWILGNKLPNPNNQLYFIKLPNNNYKLQNNTDTIIYICKAKENLFEIARKNNVSVDEILLWNNIIPSKKLKKNQEIIILK